jgi:hypothetical protein
LRGLSQGGRMLFGMAEERHLPEPRAELVGRKTPCN